MARLAREEGHVMSNSSAPGRTRPSLLRRIFTTDDRAIGISYLLLSLTAVAAGTLLSLAMRTQLAWPGIHWPFHGPMLPEEYLSLVTMHGTLMVFFVLTTAPQSGFASLVLASQIGARRMAMPWLNALGFWIVALALAVLLSAFLLPAGGPISGWTSYPPYSAVASAGPGQGGGMDCWLLSIGLFCIGSWFSAVNVLVTVLTERARGMTLGRMPLTVWSWLVSSILILLAFTVLFAALVLLFCDRHLGTAFFIPQGDWISGQIVGHGDGSPLLWLHLFWFFGHPEVYIAILPGMGLVSGIIANFSRRTIVGYRMMVAATVLIGLLGFLVWGHHMFVSGMNPYAGSAFALTTMAIAVPSTAEVFSWLGTLWGGGLRRTTPMLFALGFLSLFIAGGVTGPILALPALDQYLHNTFFVVAHFHLIMAMAGAFSIFAGIYYWFPLMTGRLMSERLGRWHFWLSLVAAYGTFFPMHLEGLAGRPRHYAQVTGSTSSLASLLPMERGVTWAAFVLGAAQLLFLINIVWSARHGAPAGDNPWQATTLEWQPAPLSIRVERGPYEYHSGTTEVDFTPQWETASQQE
jgi:cytochrome c oxidase subunit 1